MTSAHASLGETPPHLTIPTAMSRVLSIPELFEAILVQLSIRDLLLSQLVSTSWASTISSSPALQQKLFFAPISSNSSQRRDTRETKADPEFNTLLTSLFPPFFWAAERGRGTEECLDLTPIYALPWHVDEIRRAKVLREEASWREMYFMQPAKRVGKLEMWGGCYCGGIEKEVWGIKEKFRGRESGMERKDGDGTMKGSVGATMGFLYDLIIWIADEWPEVGFWVDMGFPYPESSSDTSSEVSVDVHGLVGDDDGPLSGSEVGGNEGEEGEEVEDDSFNIVIKHSESCYSSRGDKVVPSGLMIRGFEEDVIELLESGGEK